MNKKAFTLLELFLALIILGVLTTLALPKLFSMVEYTRSTEALRMIGHLRRSVEACHARYLANPYTGGGTSNFCRMDADKGWNDLNIEDPSDEPGSHFQYKVFSFSSPGPDGIELTYQITAIRNSHNTSTNEGAHIVYAYSDTEGDFGYCASGDFKPLHSLEEEDCLQQGPDCGDVDFPSILAIDFGCGGGLVVLEGKQRS